MYMMIILVMSYSWKPLDANDSQWIWIVNALRVISSRTFEKWGKKYQAVNPRKGELVFTLLMIWVQEGRTTKGAFCTILLLILWYFLIKKKNSMIFINFGLINTNLDLKYSRSMLTSPNKRLISSTCDFETPLKGFRSSLSSLSSNSSNHQVLDVNLDFDSSMCVWR